MTDMEGVAGILNWEKYADEGAPYYEQARRLLTGEVNAAIKGFAAGGFDEFYVQIGHHDDSIDIEQLDERAELASGTLRPIWPWGLDRTFSALAFVGQHGKAGSDHAHLAHTGNLGVIDQEVNGLSIGEYGALALCAMELGIPTIFASGDAALADEARALTPGVAAVAVKRGLNPDRGESAALDRAAYEHYNLAAAHRTPAMAQKLIEAGAREAARKLAAEPGAFHYPELHAPYKVSRHYRGGGHPGDPADCKPFTLTGEAMDFITAINRLYKLQEKK